jgi:hypothetical protein
MMEEVAADGWDITTAMTNAVQLATSKGEDLTWSHFEHAMHQRLFLKDHVRAVSGDTEEEIAVHKGWRIREARAANVSKERLTRWGYDELLPPEEPTVSEE